MTLKLILIRIKKVMEKLNQMKFLIMMMKLQNIIYTLDKLFKSLFLNEKESAYINGKSKGNDISIDGETKSKNKQKLLIPKNFGKTHLII